MRGGRVTESRRARRVALRLRRRGEPPDLRDRAELLTDRVVVGMFQEIPAYANADAGFREVVGIVVRKLVDQVLELFVELRHATHHEVQELVSLCIPPVEQGVTLEDMLEVFRIAQDVLWWELDRVVEEGALAEPRMALELSHLGVDYITALARGVASEYVHGERVWLARQDAERALIRGVLDAPPRIEEATRACHALDLRLLGEWRCVLYEPAGDVSPSVSVERIGEQIDGARRELGCRAALVVDAERVVLALQDGSAAPPPPPGARAGVGGRHAGAQGMRISYDEAREALTAAERRGLDVLDIEGARLDRILMGSLSPAQLAAELLAKVEDEPSSRQTLLLETLEAWLDEQGSVTETAKRLHLHPQSTRYRMERVREFFGELLDDPDGRLQLHLAVKSRRVS